MFLTYLLLRFITFPFAFLPYRTLHALGKCTGTCIYYLVPKYRKKALSNLALAKDLSLANEEVRRIAKASLQNLMITCLEYPKLARETDISNIALCENPETANALMEKGKGVLFFCGHQSNWELLFLEGTSRMPGVAIGRPVKNRYLYNWVLSIREKFGGKMVPPKNAIHEGLRALKKGAFLGIVGDQGMPNSGYSSSFLGREAWTSPLPALLAYKTNTPILVATTKRIRGKYHIHYSEPIFPKTDQLKEKEVQRLMSETLQIFQESIKENPEEWLWCHNRWKQQTLDEIKRPYRQDSVACILPEDVALIEKLPLLRKLYPREHIALFVPKSLQSKISLNAEIYPYTNLEEVFQEDLRFKLIVNFTKNFAIESHYKKLSALHTLHLNSFEALEAKVRNA